ADLLEKARDDLCRDLSERKKRGQSVVMFFDTMGARDHFTENRRIGKKITLEIGILSEGFIWEALGLVIVAEADLYGRQKLLGRRYDPDTRTGAKPRQGIGTRVADLTCIEPGDIVVHVEYGLGKYCGLFEISVGGVFQEVLSIEYADGAKVYIPVLQAHLLTKYIGTSQRHVRLHRLGGKRWLREKDDVESSLRDLAASLLKTQAERETLSGYSFSHDPLWQHEFDGSFPYRETVDQQNAIQAIKEDMESKRPMDRLVCGDAGYGKTEVAMRAAFKAVMDGKQVAVLVPTTVLAQQHFESFTNRMAAYPVRIAMLSRFRTLGNRAQTKRGLAEGTVDIVIGTHALLQDGVRFRDLGLVVIDEEQRFGVWHKEWLKNRKQLVDVLTLTATPIPRTLYMGLSGTRDMSLIQTPPSERTAIQTIVTRNTDKVVRDAILRELNREGQVFFLHNRVMTIDRVKTRLESLVPTAKIAVAHGQMGAGALAAVMQKFVAGEYDVLLCTTIIESGVDIPRANTILIDRADRFGIADLYQLRGRVGRSSHKAYAFLILPAEGTLSGDARSRIKALSKYSSLSAGFNLALRDLEIRGAGNMLGSMQSGYIAAIGFGLYCQLLRRTVAGLKHEELPPVIDVKTNIDFISLAAGKDNADSSAVIPHSYIEDEGLRIELYRKIAGAAFLKEISALKGDISDRFGPIPEPIDRLLKITKLRIICAEKNITAVETRDDKVIFMRGHDYLKQNQRFPRLKGTTSTKRLNELLKLARTVDDWAGSKKAVNNSLY
ncbi:MAG: transcription-repair coupling factor, partial [Kiritimatiellae bacterium]|nr:transcription-repair coupling factor [Kiritimatiellia bacterium]